MTLATAEPASGPATSVRALCRLAWPAILSYVLSNTYRVNDQFWIQNLGGEAQAAIGASMFVLIMNFAILFLAVGGALSLVARATGAGDRELRDKVIRHTFLLGLAIGIVLSTLGPPAMPWVVQWIGVEGRAAELAVEYLSVLFLFMLPMLFMPVLDNVLIGMGNTVVPLLTQIISLAVNFVLNPVFIYGANAVAEAPSPLVRPIAEWTVGLAEPLGLENGMGLGGAALATVISRTLTALLSIGVLTIHYRVRIVRWARVEFGLLRDLVAISAPVSLSIALYAGVYWVMLEAVMEPLGPEVIGGLGVGFQVFEGISFPCYMGIAMAAASLVGRCLGAGNRAAAQQAVRNAYLVGSAFGAAIAAAFWFAGPHVVPLFTRDAGVEREALTYVKILAFSQLFVAFESVNEKVLTGAGMTRPALWISGTGNLLRIPLAWALAYPLGLAASGIWWAINATTLLKAILLFRVVRRGHWLEHQVWSAASANGPGPEQRPDRSPSAGSRA